MMNHGLTLSSGWYDVETSTSGYWRWTGGVFGIVIDEVCEYNYLILTAENNHLKKQIKVVTKNKHGGESIVYDSIQELKHNISIKIPLKDVRHITVFNGTFTPSLVNPDWTDDRELGMMISKIILEKGDQTTAVPIETISCLKDDRRFQNIKNVDDNLDKFIQFHKLEKDESVFDKITVVLTCHGNRQKFGKLAYESILSSGIKNVVIVLSGNDKQYKSWAESLEEKCSVLIIEDDTVNNNKCWLKGVKWVNTEFVIILHDDDVLLPVLKDEIKYLNTTVDFAIWNSSQENFETKQPVADYTLELFLKRGIYPTVPIRELVRNRNFAISPIHGCFKTKLLIECLETWEKEQGSNTFFYERPSFVVGNDFFIWEYFTRNPDKLCLVLPERCCKCISHTGSATYIDITKEKPGFHDIYSEVKRIYISDKVTHGMLMYLYNSSDKHKKSLENLSQYKMSQHNVKSLIYSDNELDLNSYIRFPTLDKMSNGHYRKQDKYAYWAFVEGIKIALEKEWDYFFCYEWDCKVGCDYWYDVLWQEHLAWNHKPIVTGSPAVRCPKISTGDFFHGMYSYMYEYAKVSGVSMNLDFVSPISVYTNGALTFYDTKETAQLFYEEINTDIRNKSEWVDLNGCWDYGLGAKIFKKYGEESFKKVGWLPSSYSGCGDYCYNEDQRISMLESGKKVVIHQFKYK